MKFSQFFSVDSPKAIKAQEYGWLNAINYMAPAELGGVGNLCPHSSAACRALCLGWFSGQASMVKKGTGKRVVGYTRKSRVAKAQMFMKDRDAFLKELAVGINRVKRKARQEGLEVCVRLNGATDIAWEGIRFPNSGSNVFDLWPLTQFVDYTKSKRRALNHSAGMFPPNYHLTFSRSETNEDDCETVLASGGNVAVVSSLPPPATYLGYPVIDGDKHDLRHLDPKGVVVWLKPKGAKAKADKSGFVVRELN
jgi:hypothetical protein